jgi:alkylation response protein AidB-like acyl-CoA dehydrogenase
MNTDWVALMTELGRDFATRAAEHDSNDLFVGENYARLRKYDAFAAGVPDELGGGGASHEVLCEMIRELSRHCGSTGLAFSMHTHLVGTLAFLWRSGNKAPEMMLRRVATEKLILVSSGGSDWLPGSGRLEKVDGGFRFTARKVFSSGVPAGDILMTTGVYDDPADGATVYHFPLSLKSEGVKVLETWQTIGMRGTGSHDIEINNVFLPDTVMQGVKRPAGKWHPFMHAVVLVALPIFNAAYLGVVESAREVALSLAVRKKEDPLIQLLVGEMENQIVTAQIAHASMRAMTTKEKPGAQTTSAMMCLRTIFVNAVTRAVEKAMEVGGGAAFYRSTGLERCFRDIQGARYHPIPEKGQARLTGRFLLGLDLDG